MGRHIAFVDDDEAQEAGIAIALQFLHSNLRLTLGLLNAGIPIGKGADGRPDESHDTVWVPRPASTESPRDSRYTRRLGVLPPVRTDAHRNICTVAQVADSEYRMALRSQLTGSDPRHCHQINPIFKIRRARLNQGSLQHWHIRKQMKSHGNNKPNPERHIVDLVGASPPPFHDDNALASEGTS
jgi:hypothetical protein